ncbi:MAG TPA: hypothetical protein VG474_13190, partial [Solirubrobacteraceae bacterium]|nr:hypothetical protein [Solirubrobacteraceae bacterium]
MLTFSAARTRPGPGTVIRSAALPLWNVSRLVSPNLKNDDGLPDAPTVTTGGGAGGAARATGGAGGA